MSWGEIRDNAPKPTEAQIKYAEDLVRERYGDIDCGIENMSITQINEFIDDLLNKPPEKVKIKHVYTPRPETERRINTNINLMSLFEEPEGVAPVSAVIAAQRARDEALQADIRQEQLNIRPTFVDMLHNDISEEERQRMHEIFRSILSDNTISSDNVASQAINAATTSSIFTAEMLERTISELQSNLRSSAYNLGNSNYRNIGVNTNPSTRGDNNE